MKFLTITLCVVAVAVASERPLSPGQALRARTVPDATISLKNSSVLSLLKKQSDECISFVGRIRILSNAIQNTLKNWKAAGDLDTFAGGTKIQETAKRLAAATVDTVALDTKAQIDELLASSTLLREAIEAIKAPLKYAYANSVRNDLLYIGLLVRPLVSQCLRY
ncbi:hypothetical protein BGX33_001450 [Mortierella sp. NVP41]|nr:hypothetical protein BGX33_001450 [Mortierella sp. NVP41]